MAWNEPGKNGKDPWGGGGGKQSPPDLEELLRRLRRRLGGLGGGGGASAGIFLIIAVLLVIWLLSGFYKVDSPEKAAVQRFGKLVAFTGPGLHWHLPYPIGTAKKVNVSQIHAYSFQSNMLTSDENKVFIDLEVQYRINNARDYLFKINNADASLDQMTKSAIRQVVGTLKMNAVLSGKVKHELAKRAHSILQKKLDAYNSGLKLVTINIKSIQPPEKVQPAFTDAIKAQEEKQRDIGKAQAYTSKILPRAKGDAAKTIAEAKGYAEKAVQQAQGHTSEFEQLLPVYHKAPKVTRTRLYLDTMQAVLEHSSKVLLDIKKGNPLIYLPLNKLVQGKAVQNPPQGSSEPSNQSGDNHSQSSQNNDATPGVNAAGAYNRGRNR
jgi:membrane protease subunit HflK